MAFTPNSRYLAAGPITGHTYIWELATNKIVADLPDPDSKGVRSVAFSPNGEFLAEWGCQRQYLYLGCLEHWRLSAAAIPAGPVIG